MFCSAKGRYPPWRIPQVMRSLADRQVLRGYCLMRRVVFLSAVFCLFSFLPLTAQQKTVETIPVDQIHPGMKGFPYTVFQGTNPEAINLKVFGVLKPRVGTTFHAGMNLIYRNGFN